MEYERDGEPIRADAEPERVHAITSVQRALSEDVDDRAKRYAFSMAVRTACIIIAILAPSPWRWIAIAGAVVIPLIAVLVANAGRELPSRGTVEDPRAVTIPEGPPVAPQGRPYIDIEESEAK